MPHLPSADLAALGHAVDGLLVLPTDQDYDAIHAGFNGMIDKRHAAIVRVTGGRLLAHDRHGLTGGQPPAISPIRVTRRRHSSGIADTSDTYWEGLKQRVV